MPSFPRKVGFAPNESVSRPASEDELRAVYNYARHASHCDRCADPYRVHLAGKTLCDRGHHYARNVAKHLELQRGRPCSTVDGHDYQSVEVEIPVGCDVVRGLLKAIERGLRLRRSKQSSSSAIVSYDRTYLVQPRRAETVRPKERRPKDSRARVEIVEPPRSDYRDTKVVYINRDGSPYRPSLLEAEGDYEVDDGRIVYASPRSTSYRHGQEEFYR
ncbi:MAG: hypothetical protein M1815_000685 [Lichina confinis]|nr:MAG: hypothetical protein M1815_000685 [Lichina confinis]